MKSTTWIAFILVMVTLLTGCSQIQWVHKDHSDPDLFNRDNYECEYMAKTYAVGAAPASDRVNPYASYNTQLAQSAMNGLVAGIAQGMIARGEYIKCMQARGYYQATADMIAQANTPTSYVSQPATDKTDSLTLQSFLQGCDNPEACVEFGLSKGYTDVEICNLTTNTKVLEYVHNKWRTEPSDGNSQAKKEVVNYNDSIAQPLQTSPSQTTYQTSNREAAEYWCWSLGVIVKTEAKTTIAEISDEGYSNARTFLKTGDEIVRIGKQDIDRQNAYKILTKSMPGEEDGLVNVVVRRDDRNIECRIKPNVF